MGVVCRYRGNRGYSCSPDLIIKGTEACYLPGLLGTYVTDLVEDVWQCGSMRDENIIGQEFDASIHMLRRIDKG